MDFMLKYALAMHMPEGKRAGYYAQIVKALAERTSLFDRDKELLIFSSPEERSAAEPVMTQYAVPAEPIDLLLLPASLQARPTFTDFGFVSRLEQQPYLYADMAALFQLTHAPAASRSYEPASAAAQLDEHVLADWPAAFDPDGKDGAGDDYGRTIFAIEAQHDRLVEAIAEAYGCAVQWRYRPQPAPHAK
ncbi:hypothetical protein P9314_10490 [Paenibacillus validus]|uniref:hypothetical protein n=1 Tax=Paenibacillus TaxID=44249 RepID=UPI0006D0BF25|nr:MULTISPECIES: hypothetical protein [Paenibacillus]MED4601130.1 hypothetical protein [Paenibacillus validus]MED4608194.1 hypothetical protein [Paenibacillus validus]